MLERCGPAKHVSRGRLTGFRTRKSSRNDTKIPDVAIPRQRLGLSKVRVRRGSAMCRSSRSCLVLARIEATPPQRVIECIDWTPSCRSRNNLANHVSVRPQPAFTPGSSFTVSVHLQLAPRNTYQPPIPHISMSPVVTQSNSPGTFLSGDGHFRPAFDLDRHSGVLKTSPPSRFPSFQSCSIEHCLHLCCP